MATYDWHLGINGNSRKDDGGISFLPNGLVNGDSIRTPMALKQHDIINFMVFDITSTPLEMTGPPVFELVTIMAEEGVSPTPPFELLATAPHPDGGLTFSPYLNGSFPSWTVKTYKAINVDKFLLTFKVTVNVEGEEQPRHFRDDPEMAVGEDR